MGIISSTGCLAILEYRAWNCWLELLAGIAGWNCWLELLILALTLRQLSQTELAFGFEPVAGRIAR